MILAPPQITQIRLPRLLHRYVLCLAVIAALVVLFSGCSTFGVATEEYVEQRVEAVDQKVIEAASVSAEALDPLFPGYATFVRATYTDRAVAPPPAPEPGLPDWLGTLGEIAAAVALSYLGVNVSRDRQRRRLGEATTIAEAVQLGQIPAPKVSA